MYYAFFDLQCQRPDACNLTSSLAYIIHQIRIRAHDDQAASVCGTKVSLLRINPLAIISVRSAEAVIGRQGADIGTYDRTWESRMPTI